MIKVDIAIDFEQVDPILKELSNTIDDFNNIVSYINNAKSNIPFEIKEKVSEKFDSISSNIILLKNDLDNNYKLFDDAITRYKQNESIEDESQNELINVFNNTFEDNLVILDANYFTNLANNGRGSIDKEKNIYTINNGIYTYTYDYKKRKLTIIDSNTNNKSSIPVGIYIPANTSDLSNYNTTTLLPGDGERRDTSRFCLDECKQINDILSEQSSNIVIIPQAKQNINGSNNYNGFIPQSFEVTQCTKFTTLIMKQNENCSNTIAGVSSGGISALKIAANEGNDIYDCVASFNGRMKTDGIARNTDYSALKEKDILFFISKDGVKNPEIIKENIQYMNDYSFSKVTVVSSDPSIIKKVANLNNSNINVVSLNQEEYYGHSSMWKALKNSNILNGNNKFNN